MNAIDLMKIMGKMGTMFSAKSIEEIIDYCALMLNDDRVIMISEDSNPISFIFYSITDEPEKYLEKEKYQYLTHDKSGKFVYVEKLISFHWNKYLRIIFERLITSKYPQIESGVWHRQARWGDRRVISKRRFQNV